MANLTGALRRGIAVAAVAVVLGGSVAVAATNRDQLGSDPGALRAVERVTAAPAAGVSGDRAAGSPRGAEIRARLDAELAAHAGALSRGDLAGYLAAADPALHPALRRRYDALRALRAVGFSARVVDEPTPAGERWRATVEMGFCAAAPGCGRAPAQVPTAWTVTADAVRLVEQGQSTGYGPRPWEVTELRAAVGERVVVAAPVRHANRLAAVLAAGEKAAARADGYARWRPKPSRYVVYLAGAEEWSTWYGLKRPEWAIGFAMPITPEHTEIVLNAARLDSGAALNPLTHEFAHVTTLAGVRRNYTDSWLLVEGIAEYVSHAGRPVSAYPWLRGTRRYVQGGRWPGTAALTAPAESASVSDATGGYGVAYLAVRHLANRFGEDRLLTFFAAVARDGVAPAVAAAQVFGVAWAELAADCDRFVRSTVA